jgi:molybdate transport system substrate-binding protein
MKYFAWIRSTACALFVGLGAIACAVEAAEIKVISTPAASAALKAATQDFERATGHKVILDFSNIATTRGRINAGEPFDIAVVSPKAVDDLEQQGKLVKGASLNMGRTGLALVGHKGMARPDISSADAFKRTLLNARLVAYSATGESGIGFLKVLDKLGIAAEMKPRIRSSSNMASVVESGEAELGMTGVGAGLTYTQLEYLGPLPAAIQEYVYMAAGISTDARAGEAARSLLQYLGDPAVVRAMSARGLEPPAAK